MRKLFVILLLSACASATTTVTGTVQTLGTGNVASGAYVRFWLRGCAGNQPRINGTGIIAPTQGAVFYFDFPVNASGQVSGTLYSTRDSTGLLGGDIECGGSHTSVWYGMQVFTGGKGGPEVAVHAKNAGTLDVSNVTPITTNPVIASPTGDGTYLRLDAGNSPVTGPVSFNNTVTATHGGTLGGTWAGNPTLSGNPIFSGNVSATGQNTFLAYNLDTVVMMDGNKYPCTDVGMIAAMGVLTAGNGGTLDARGCNSTITVNNPVQIGAANKPVRVLIDGATTININVTSGATTDVFPMADQSVLDCGFFAGLPNSASYYGAFKIAGTTNVRAIVAPLSRTGSQEMMGINGCNFVGGSGETIANAIIDMQGVFANSYIINTNVWNMYNTIGILLEPGTGASAGISDIQLANIQSNGAGVTGARPCVIKGNTLSHNAGSITILGGSCQHAGSGQYELELNGNNAGAGTGAVYGVDIFGLHVETVSGSLGIKVADAVDINFNGLRASGAGTSSGFINISESGSGITNAISVRGSFSTATTTNWIVNSAAGGSTIVTSTEPGDYFFKALASGITYTELSGPPSPATAAQDPCYGDATAHAVKCSYNNGSFFAQTQTIASGTAAMPTSAVAAISGSTVTCVAAAGNPFTATGVLTTDTITWVPNAAESSPNTGLFIRAWPTAGGVNFEYCNSSASNLTPGAETLNWRVVR